MAKLYIVGTPIGNLEDITLRAIRVLKEADVIACEDTRHSKVLLDRYEIKTKTISYHLYNEKESAENIIELIKKGNNVALISDAGMPAISDPGAYLVKECRNQGVQIESVPGCSAVVSAMSVSGILDKGFAFVGFLEDKKKKRKEELNKLSNIPLSLVFYCAPHDVKEDVKDILSVFGDRKVTVVKELTKLHERVTETTLKNFNEENPCGEYVLIVHKDEKRNDELLNLSIKEHLEYYFKLGYDSKEAVKSVSEERNCPKKEVYAECLKLKNKV